MVLADHQTAATDHEWQATSARARTASGSYDRLVAVEFNRLVVDTKSLPDEFLVDGCSERTRR